MSWIAAIVVFAVSWCIGLFILLPIGVRTHEEEDVEVTPGTVSSAPIRHHAGKKMAGAIVIGLLAVLVYWALIRWGGISIHDLGR